MGVVKPALDELYHVAVALEDRERARFVDEACKGYPELKRKLEGMLEVVDGLTGHRLPQIERGIAALRTGHNVHELPEWMTAYTEIDRYDLIRELGRGGMGAVFLARDKKLPRRVAIKFMVGHSVGTPEHAKPLLAEAETIAQCQHENIVVIHDVDAHRGCPYMVLEYLEGNTLRDLLRAARERAKRRAVAGHEVALISKDGASRALSEAGLPPGRAIELMVPVVRALTAAHAKGIVHCDLKPENVILTDAGTVKVLDFGIALWLSNEPTGHSVHGLGPGTPPYMSPEQLGADEIDHRSDLWAVGIMFYEIITGQHPLGVFSDASLAQVRQLDVPMPSVADTLPGLGSLSAMIDRCLLKHKDTRISAEELLAELEPLMPRVGKLVLGEDESPFPGLAAFQEADANRFFGRERDIARMVTQVRRKPLLAIHGPSGAGKSSLVRAGIIPALKRSGEGWDVFTIRPGRYPVKALATLLSKPPSVAKESSDGGGDARRDLGDYAQLLGREPGYFGAWLRARADKRLRRVLVFVDQLEELYTLDISDEERNGFIAGLSGAADDPATPVRVIVTIRSDFVHRILADDTLADAVIPGLQHLGPIGRAGRREALQRPLAAASHGFESEALVERMLDELEDTPDALPLLQFTAERLWHERDRHRRLLTEQSYKDIGGVAGALAEHADKVLNTLSQSDVVLARAVFERLVTTEHTRALASLSELRELSDDRNAIDRVIHRLTDARLLTVDDEEHAAATVELAHESLIESWPTLRSWLHENEDDLTFVRLVRTAAIQWDADGRTDDMLWRGKVAGRAWKWLEKRTTRGKARPHRALTDCDEQFLRAVLARRARYRRRVWMLAAGALAALVTGLFVISYMGAQTVRERNLARMSAARQMQDDPTLALSILRELEGSDIPEEWDALTRRALNEGVARTVLLHPVPAQTAMFNAAGDRVVTMASDGKVRIWNADGSGDPAIIGVHTGALGAALSPDGKLVATPSTADSTARLWKTDGSGDHVELTGHTSRLHWNWFSPDSRRVVTTSRDGTARIWNIDGSGDPIILPRNKGGVYTIAQFSPDGRYVLTSSPDQQLRIWNADGTGLFSSIDTGHPLTSGWFSPDGKHIVAGGGKTGFRVWPVDGSGDPITVDGGQDKVLFISYSHGGNYLVSTSGALEALVWSGRDYRKLWTLRQAMHVTIAQFNADETQITTASWDGTARIWNMHGRQRGIAFYGHKAAVQSVSFDSSGTRLVTASSDGTARIWRADGTGTVTILGDTASSEGKATRKAPLAVLSPDGTHVVTAHQDGSLRRWRASDGRASEPWMAHSSAVNSIAFSRDGRYLATASREDGVMLWESSGSKYSMRTKFPNQPSEVVSVAFSPDGARIVTWSGGNTVRVLRRDGVDSRVKLDGHRGPMHAVAFSFDGEHIATASSDKTVRIWTVDGSGAPLVLRGHTAAVHSVAFSPDGTRVASGALDGTVRVWTISSGDAIVLLGHDDAVNAVAFTPDGRYIASASTDGTARLWRTLEPLEPDDSLLWAATDYCLPISRRQELFNVSKASATESFAKCQKRVRAARNN